jgi:putative oligomerization/nucleic acid binding protein
MFGKHTRLERKLREKGASATAEVLECRLTGSEGYSGRSLNMDDPREVWKAERAVYKLKLRVLPEGAPEWEATVTCQLGVRVNARAGSRLPVLYDPDDHSELVVDTETILERLVAQAEGRRPDVVKARDDARAQAMAGDQGPAVMAAMKAALAAGDHDEFRRLKAEYSRLAGEKGEATIQIGEGVQLGSGVRIGGAPAAAGATDPLDRLQKLADLHQSGALTDAEFAAEKAKILGQE